MNNWADLNFFHSKKFKQILDFLKEERKTKNVLPEKKNIFKAFELTPFEETKVVILGQDPYPTVSPIPHAMGLAFSVPSNIEPLPPSLKNIFTEIRDDFDINHYQNPDLTRWATQGVLLLNTSLTVVANKPNSHKDIGWSALTKNVIQTINEYKENIVFILWGNNARKNTMFIDTTKHLVIESAHPSPLSAYHGFFGSKPFSKTNEYLSQHNISRISW